MTDPLAGMTREEARELVADLQQLNMPNNVSAKVEKLFALAALGAECVGAAEEFYCFDCGVHGAKDDRVCLWCSGDCRRVLVLKEDK